MADNLMSIERSILLNTPHLVTPTPAGLQSFQTDLIAPLKQCQISFSPVQSGSGDPSPTNVRPITGWTGCNVRKTGKNIFDPSTVVVNSYIRAGNTSETNPLGGVISNNIFSCTDYIKVNPNTTYTTIVPYYSEALAAGLVFYADKSVETAISGVPTYLQGSAVYTFTTPSTCNYIRFSWGDNNGNNAFLGRGQLTAEDYEPYSGNVYPVSWQSSAGTVYGGYVDLVKGELVATHLGDKFKLSDYASPSGLPDGRLIIQKTNINLGGKIVNNYTERSNLLKYQWEMPQNGAINKFFAYSSNNRLTTLLGSIDANVDMNQYFEFYALAETPVHYQLDPAAIKTLKGQNNIWSNANGDIQIKYWKH